MVASGQVAERFLAPEWRTVVGVIRSRIAGTAGPRRWTAVAPGMRYQMVLLAEGRPPDADARENWQRFWVRRDGVFRVESSSTPDGDPFIIRRRSADGSATVTLPGQGTRAAQNDFEWTHGLWMLEPAVLAGAFELTFGDGTAEVLGREALVVTGRARSAPERWASPAALLLGTDPGERCELVVDAATGICLRVTNSSDGVATATHELTALDVDGDVDDSVGEWASGPGERLRTPVDDLLDHLRVRGVEVDDIDPDSDSAMDEARRRLEADAGRSPTRPSRPSPTLRQTVAPLGPPPADRDAAVEAISSAVAGLGPDDARPRAETIEHGDLLDEDDAAHGGRPTHPMITRPARFDLDEVVFLTADIAFIELRIDIGQHGGGFPFSGRAVRRHGRWLVSYDTAARLRAMAGRPVPPLVDGDGDR